MIPYGAQYPMQQAPQQPLGGGQTPRSQALAAALQSLGSPANSPTTPGALGADLGAAFLLHQTQQQQPGQGQPQSPGGLMGLGKMAMNGLGAMGVPSPIPAFF